MRSALPRLIAAMGAAALTASLLAQRPAPPETQAVEAPAVEPELPPGVVDATDSGLVVRLQHDGELSLRLLPGAPRPPGQRILTTRGPVTPDRLDAITAARPDASTILVYAYDPSSPDPVVLHHFTPQQGWTAAPLRPPRVLPKAPPVPRELIRPRP